ncbi:MAG: response regulator [Bryobacterales bacterium]
MDDEATGRRVLRRWIERGFDGKVVEACNGLEALEALAAEEFDLVVLDLQMPVLDGTETLSLIRSDPKYGNVEVVVATQLASEQKVRDIISLGVADYILKPLRYGAVVERLHQIVNRAREKRKERSRQNELPAVLFADPDPNFCDFATTAIAGRFQGIAVRTASETVVRILKNEPTLVMLSPQLPGLPFEILVKKVVALAKSRHGRVGLITDARTDNLDPAFVGQVVRTFVPETFSADIAKLLAGVAATGGEDPWLKALEPEITSALRQAFGMMTGKEPVVAETPAAAEAELFGTILLQAKSGEFDLRIELQCQRPFAVALCNTLLGKESEDADQAAIQSGLGNILSSVGGRIQNSCQTRRIELTLGLPELHEAPPAKLDPFYTWEQSFTWQGPLWFRLRVLGAAGTARPAEAPSATASAAAPAAGAVAGAVADACSTTPPPGSAADPAAKAAAEGAEPSPDTDPSQAGAARVDAAAKSNGNNDGSAETREEAVAEETVQKEA